MNKKMVRLKCQPKADETQKQNIQQNSVSSSNSDSNSQNDDDDEQIQKLNIFSDLKESYQQILKEQCPTIAKWVESYNPEGSGSVRTWILIFFNKSDMQQFKKTISKDNNCKTKIQEDEQFSKFIQKLKDKCIRQKVVSNQILLLKLKSGKSYANNFQLLEDYGILPLKCSRGFDELWEIFKQNKKRRKFSQNSNNSNEQQPNKEQKIDDDEQQILLNLKIKNLNELHEVDKKNQTLLFDTQKEYKEIQHTKQISSEDILNKKQQDLIDKQLSNEGIKEQILQEKLKLIKQKNKIEELQKENQTLQAQLQEKETQFTQLSQKVGQLSEDMEQFRQNQPQPLELNKSRIRKKEIVNKDS